MMVVAGCGGSAESAVQQQSQERVKKASDQKKPEKRPLSHYEATLRPTDFDKEIEEVQRIHVEERQREQLVIPKDSMALVEETILGFRIQILSTSNIDDAEESRRAAQQLFLSDTVYVVYDPPVYKVRVGDFQTRLESNGRLADVQERGYKDAWVVPDNVLRRKWIAVRRDEDMREE
jgi:hypothetical protein